MPESPGDDNNDSRTASVGAQRNRATSTNGSRQSSIDSSNSHPRKRQRRNGKVGPTDARDFVPQGATFSANTLEVDPDSTSSSGSSGSDDESNSSDDGNEASSQAGLQSAAAPNWNKASKSTIRTSLNKRGTKANEGEQDSRFDAVNDKYWRSRSESVSTGSGNDIVSQTNSDGASEEGEVQEDASSDSSRMHLSGDSDDSSLDSEADDSILLNINSRGQIQSASQKQNGRLSLHDDDYDPESLPGSQSITNGHAFDGAADAPPTSKEAAFRLFAQKYPTNPETLADLNREDMEAQARYIFYDREINDINLQLPVACTECMREGHLAEVCPYKECVHCGAWDQHQSSFCPSWRRCQKCRERGHDQRNCPSLLKGSASEIPCDLCGSSAHLELECDFMWKAHRQEPPTGPVLVSISCSHCTSSHHLVGDCPSLPQPLKSSSWTLRGIDPNMVTNINSVVNGRSGGPSSRGRGGMKIRGRADAHSSPDDSDDLMTRRRPVGRGGNRGNIRIGSGIGKNKNLAPAGSRGPDMDSRQFYRDRQDFNSGNARQRSLSPNPRRGRGKDSWQPAPRSPPRGQSRPPPRGGRGGGRGRGGRGSGNKRGGNGDAYRPMPSAAKKAWDKYRL